jgi:hypothetical protein
MNRIVVRSILFLLIVSAFLLSGCANQKAWIYKAEPHVVSTPILNKSVAVPPLMDQRENANTNAVLMYLIPLMPFGWQNLNTPETIQMHLNSGLWTFKPPEDFAKAIAEELNNSSIFKEVFFTHRESEAELAFRGKILSTKYDGYMFTYGLSVYGALPWFFFFPATYVSNELGLQMQLVDLKTQDVLWEQSYKKEDSHVSIIYALQPDFMYDKFLKDIMKEAMASIKSKLAKKVASEQKEAPPAQKISKKVESNPSVEITKPNIPSSSNSGTQSNSSSLTEKSQKLRELKKLKDEGLLTDKEYEQKRKSIVEGM